MKRWILSAVFALFAATASAQNCLTESAQTFCAPDVTTAGLPDTRMSRLNELDLIILQQGAMGNGVVEDVFVVEEAVPALSVAVTSGSVFINETLVAVASGSLSITAASVNPRWELVSVNSSGTKAVTVGAESTSPRPPALPANSVALALVWVAPGDTSITSLEIVPKRMIVNALPFDPAIDVTFTGDVSLEGTTTSVGRLMLPMGEVSYFDTTGTAVVIAAQSDGSTNMVKAAPTTAGNFDHEFDNGGANNGRLRYTGAVTKSFHVAVTWSILGGGAATDNIVIAVAQNGTPVAAGKVLQGVTNANIQGNALHVMLSLATNQYIEVYFGNLTDTDDIVLKSLNIFAMGM